MMILLSLPMMAQEEDSIPQKPLVKFGFLSYEAALKAMPEYEAVQQHMESLRTAFQTEMQRVEDEFNRKYEDFLEGQKDFPRTILLKRQTELQEMLQRNLQFKQQSLDELKQTEKELLTPLSNRLNETIATIAYEQELALVVNTDANACPFINPQFGVDLNMIVLQQIAK